MGLCATFNQDEAWRNRANKDGYLEVWNAVIEGQEYVILMVNSKKMYRYNINGDESIYLE
jgi:hypothetical protein